MCAAAYTQLARQTSALCALGVQPKAPWRVQLQVTKSREVYTLESAGGDLQRGRADSAEGVGAQSGKGAHST